MLTYNFTNTGSDSLYEYLYKCIKNDILQGTIQGGEKLPSKRTFAKNLGISVITVENAYEQLIAEGYIYSIPKRGFYVIGSERQSIIQKKAVQKGTSDADRRRQLLILQILQVIRRTARSFRLQSGRGRCVKF